MAKKSINFEALEQAGNDAALTEKQSGEVVTMKSKTIKTIPSNYFTAHENLKSSGKTGLLLTAYMIEALREKLERDGAL